VGGSVLLQAFSSQSQYQNLWHQLVNSTQKPYAEGMCLDWQISLSQAELQALLDGEQEMVQTDPRQAPWGYFLRSGELGYFSWFSSQAQLLQYLLQVEVLHAPQTLPDQASYQAKVAQLLPALQAYASGNQSAALTCEALNPCLPGFELLWLGHFSELLQGTEAFALQLRSAYQGQSEPISAEQQANFAEWLGDYGL